MKIKAAVARQIDGHFSVEDVVLAEPQAGEVLVKLVATGLCHTDYAIIEQIMPIPLPMVLGHEGAGVIVGTGPGVEGFEPGDHVVLTFDTCGHCDECSHGHPAYCAEFMPRNFATRRMDGSTTLRDLQGEALGSVFFSQSSLATHAIARSSNAIKVRKDAPLELLGPLGCGLSTGAGTVMNVLKPESRHTIAVFGTGAVGMGALLAAKAMGAGKIIAVDRVASRLELASALGATDTIDTSKVDLAERLAELGGIDFGVDTSGVPVLIAAATDALKQRGTLVLLGASKQQQVTLNVLPLISGKVIRGVTNGDMIPTEFIPKLVDMFVDGQFPIDKISAFYSLAEVNKALEDSLSGKTIKPIIRMEAAQ